MSRGNGGIKRELLLVTLSLYLKGWGRKTVVRRGMSIPHIIHDAALSRMTCRGRWNDHVLPMLVSVVSRVRSTPSLQLDKRTLQHQQRVGVRAEQERVASHLKRCQLWYIYPSQQHSTETLVHKDVGVVECRIAVRGSFESVQIYA